MNKLCQRSLLFFIFFFRRLKCTERAGWRNETVVLSALSHRNVRLSCKTLRVDAQIVHNFTAPACGTKQVGRDEKSGASRHEDGLTKQERVQALCVKLVLIQSVAHVYDRGAWCCSENGRRFSDPLAKLLSSDSENSSQRETAKVTLSPPVIRRVDTWDLARSLLDEIRNIQRPSVYHR